MASPKTWEMYVRSKLISLYHCR